ncbi:MAG: SpoIIE family protein phosphatase [Lachnospiraceae bacterium]|nr:SpoIIE family protein phosphatase [Lachnospiraceae bacterium]
MKRRRPIFWSSILIILPIVIVAVLLVLNFAYKYVSNKTYEHHEEDVERAAFLVDEIIGNRDLNDRDNAESCNIILNKLCRIMKLPYIYILEVDEEGESIKYLSLGAGEEATDEFIYNRHIGTVIEGPVDPNIIAVLKSSGSAVAHLNNEFSDTMIAFKARSARGITNQVVCTEVNITTIVDDLNHDFNYFMLTTVLFSIAMVLLFALILRNKISRPANEISKKMSSFVHDRESGFEKLEVKGSREFCEMANSFNAMAEEIDNYIEDVSELNRQKAELNIAREIQMGLLEPTDFEGRDALIKAYMLPAKDVGGDLYDYKVLDDGKVFVVIADVSGKGVSAAMFMSRAITLLQQYAEAGLSPGRILYEYNNHLADHNPNMLFITTFVGIYDAVTGNLVYANAGHNVPYVVSDRLIRLDGEHGMAAGVFKNEEYQEHTVKMQAGDLLFLYTDGVTEAQDKNGAMFSEQRLETELEKLAYCTSVSEENLKQTDVRANEANPEISADSEDMDAVAFVLKRLEEFTKDAQQNDDITMLTLLIPKKLHKHLRVEAKASKLTEVFEAIEQIDVPKDIKNQLKLIAEEMFINICSYAYADGAGSAEVIIDSDKKSVNITFIDSGKPFDPTKEMPDIEQYDYDNAIGGLGRFITFQMADDYSYEHDGTHNILRITKYV